MRIEIKALLFLLYFASSFYVIFTFFSVDKAPFYVYAFTLFFLIFVLVYGIFHVRTLKTYGVILKTVFSALSIIAILILIVPFFNVLRDVQSGVTERHCVVTTYYDASIVKEKSRNDNKRDIEMKCDGKDIVKLSYLLPSNKFFSLFSDKKQFLEDIKVGDNDIIRSYLHSDVNVSIEYPTGKSNNIIGIIDIISFLCLIFMFYLLSKMKSDDIETFKILSHYRRSDVVAK